MVVVDSAVEGRPVIGNTSSKTDVPKWVQKYLNQEDAQKISDLVQSIETKTRAEIVPMIVLRSSVVGHVQLLLTLILLLIFIPLEFYYFNWSSVYVFDLWLGLSALAAYGLSLALSGNLWLQRVLTPNADESTQVWNRAELEFYRQQMSHTKSRAGVFLFVSIMERKAVLLTDETINKVLPNEVWSPLLKEFSLSLHKGEWAKGFSAALERCGELLAEKFPSQGHQGSNELANFLRIKE